MASPDDLSAQFSAAAEHLRSLVPTLSPEQLLHFYGLYKQATVGPCNTEKPGWFQFEAKQKWEAWKSLGTMSTEEAMSTYVSLISSIDPDWEAGETESGSKGWVSVSCFSSEPALEENMKTVFDHVQEGDVKKIRLYAEGNNINVQDEEGMGLLHWAADRGNDEMVQCLIELGSAVNLKDESGQTPLHYACSCGHMDVIKTLLKHGADPSVLCNEGCSPADVAIDETVRSLIVS